MITPRQIDYKSDWIIGLGYSNLIISDGEKLHNMTKYKGSRMMTMDNNSRIPITYISKTTIPCYNPNQVSFQDVYHVLGITENLISVA